MKTNPSTLNQNLSTISEISETRSFNFKRLAFCSLAWVAIIVLYAAIAIAQAPASQTAQRSDGLIETDVVQALDSAIPLQGAQITAATIQGEVTLTGSVDSEGSRQLAESLAKQVSGVTHVDNNLKIASATVPVQAQPQAQVQPQPQLQTQRPAYSQSQPSDEDQSRYPEITPPPQQGYSNIAPQQNPQQHQPNPAYGARAPELPYDPTPLTLLKGTSIDLRTNQFLDNKSAKDGTTFELTVVRDVYVTGRLAIPRGAVVHGVVVESKSAGDLGGAPSLALKLVSIDLGPNNYPLSSDLFKVRGPNKGGYTAGNIVGGSIFGALIGAAIGRGPGAAIGAVAGAGAGTAVSAATPGPRAWIPAEALVTFHLQDPVTVVPVTTQEAARLYQSVMPGNQPTLYRRAPGYYAGYAPGYYAPGYYGPGYYPAPMPFYHPYYVVSGYYYWR